MRALIALHIEITLAVRSREIREEVAVDRVQPDAVLQRGIFDRRAREIRLSTFDTRRCNGQFRFDLYAVTLEAIRASGMERGRSRIEDANSRRLGCLWVKVYQLGRKIVSC